MKEHNKKVKLIGILVGHVLLLSILLYPTIMELADRRAGHTSYEEYMAAPEHLRDGNMMNGELTSSGVLYAFEIGPIRIHSLLVPALNAAKLQ